MLSIKVFGYCWPSAAAGQPQAGQMLILALFNLGICLFTLKCVTMGAPQQQPPPFGGKPTERADMSNRVEK